MKKTVFLSVAFIIVLAFTGWFGVKKYFKSSSPVSDRTEKIVKSAREAKKQLVSGPNDAKLLFDAAEKNYKLIVFLFSNGEGPSFILNSAEPSRSIDRMISIFKQLGYDFSKVNEAREKGKGFFLDEYKKKKDKIKDNLIDETIEYYRKALQITSSDPKNPPPKYFHELGVLYYMKGHTFSADATKYILRAVNMGYETPWGLCFLGNIYYEIDSLDNAIIYYKKSLKELPEEPVILFNLAWTYKEAGFLDDARTTFKHLIEVLGSHETLTVDEISVILKSHFALGHIELSERKTPRAVKEFLIVTQLEPMSLEGLYWLGKSYYLNNQKELAKKTWRELLKLDASYKDTRKLYEKL